MTFRFGKKPARPGAVRWRLTSYTNTAALLPLPARFGHDGNIGPDAWGMLANDRYGDCVFAGAAHETMLLVGETGGTVTFTDANVLADYAAVTGFDPAKPDTDQGADMQEAAAYRRKTGIVDAQGDRHKIAAYLALEPGNLQHLFLASYLFGAVGIGLQLPASALLQTEQGLAWDVVADTTIAGGHYVPLVGRQVDGLHVVSWGAIQRMTEAFLTQYCDEAVAYVSQECLLDQKSPEGFAYDDLISDLAALA
jgi:hypothetical protein